MPRHTVGALAPARITGIGAAPAANATCASFFGIGNSATCTTNLTRIAIAVGSGNIAVNIPGSGNTAQGGTTTTGANAA